MTWHQLSSLFSPPLHGTPKSSGRTWRDMVGGGEEREVGWVVERGRRCGGWWRGKRDVVGGEGEQTL